MTNFLNLPIEIAEDDPYGLAGPGAVLPDDQCRLYPCKKDRVFRPGDTYVRFDSGYVHVECMDSLIKELGSDDFLIMLARHVAVAPSRHNAGTVRQVINGLVKLLGRTQAQLDQEVADAYAKGARETAEAIAEAGGSTDLPIDATPAIANGEDEGA